MLSALMLMWSRCATTRRQSLVECQMIRSRPNVRRTYLQALRKMSPNKVTIIEGKIMAETPVLRLVNPLPECPGLSHVKVHDFTEKKTDVNLAADLITGAWTGAYEQAVICSNDTDLGRGTSGSEGELPGSSPRPGCADPEQ